MNQNDDYGRLPAEGLVRREKVLEVVPISLALLKRKVDAGEFPAPVKISGRAVAWRVEDVRAWLAGLGKSAA
ncbi:helix-turn-helix transcriptional regulator [Thauera mechernichensis]